VFNAPRRRVDNEISRLYENVSSLIAHCKVIDQLAYLYTSKLWNCRFKVFGSLCLSASLTFGVHYLQRMLSSNGSNNNGNTPIPTTNISSSNSSNGDWMSNLWQEIIKNRLLIGTATISSICTMGYSFLQFHKLHNFQASFQHRSAYEDIFKSVYAKEMLEKNEFVAAIGEVVLDEIPKSIVVDMIPSLRRVHKNDFQALERILNEDVANLRRRASPSFPVITPPEKLKYTNNNDGGDEEIKEVDVENDLVPAAFAPTTTSP
jgi:hypothetical protein